MKRALFATLTLALLAALFIPAPAPTRASSHAALECSNEGLWTSLAATQTVTFGCTPTDDWLIVINFQGTVNRTPTIPTGYTQAHNQGGNTGVFQIYKVASSEGTTQDITFSGTQRGAYSVQVWSGMETSSVLDANYGIGTTDNSSTTSITLTAGSTLEQASNVAIVAMHNDASAGTEYGSDITYSSVVFTHQGRIGDQDTTDAHAHGYYITSSTTGIGTTASWTNSLSNNDILIGVYKMAADPAPPAAPGGQQPVIIQTWLSTAMPLFAKLHGN